jgi:hypothetical protein
MYDLDIKEALSQLPQQEVDLRNQWLKRGMDYSCERIYLPKALQVWSLCLSTTIMCIVKQCSVGGSRVFDEWIVSPSLGTECEVFLLKWYKDSRMET